ncbi:hypothetical protein [Pseudomonas sp. P7759]|uniref:hypothetical protein n=1 Tax=Pseudomonas sp. P7759 TaxID=2738831 RepID=UPI002108CFDD|nr:hypothetical protein [Pseudomonas sp. P7759]
MRVLVTPLRDRGVALSKEDRRRYPAIRGSVLVNAETCQELGRSSNVAHLVSGMPMEAEPLPPLLDATLAGMANTGFVLSGIEFIDGCAYAQTWWCREA